MRQAHILLVEDENHIAQGLVFNLEHEGYRVTHVETGACALAAYDETSFDLIILDLMLPDAHGLDICRKVRETDRRLPILILTALGEEQDRVTGLQEGADDYLSKPFNLDEFLLRVQGILRRSGWYQEEDQAETVYRFGQNRVDLGEMHAETARGEVVLTELEGRMLATFFAAEGRTLSRAELLKSVWGLAEDTETRSLDNFIVRLRKYFEPDPGKPVHFQTVRGRGYRFIREPQ